MVADKSNFLLPKIGGIYQHYKRGSTYEVIGIARHSETDQELVIYKSLYEDANFPIGTLWARPAEMFLEVIESNGEVIRRFREVK